MNVWFIVALIVGVVLILVPLAAFIICSLRTPSNLRGFYGKMFSCLTAFGVIGGTLLIVIAFACLL